MSADKRFARAVAMSAAAEICAALKPCCALVEGKPRLIVAGSLRRRKPDVGDIEVLYVPIVEERPNRADWFAGPVPVNLVDATLDMLLKAGIITKRLTTMGSETWGQRNKFAVHTGTGIPVDFFEATEPNWFNYVVCRTGGADSNMRIATAYQMLGCKWNPYSIGFTNAEFREVRNGSEREVFENAGLKYLEPWER